MVGTLNHSTFYKSETNKILPVHKKTCVILNYFYWWVLSEVVIILNWPTVAR